MSRTKRPARKRLSADRGNLHTNGSMSMTTQAPRVTDSYRPGQERDKARLEDQPMHDAAETDNPPKRHKAADGDFYRPYLRPRPLPPYNPPPESDTGYNIAALGRTRLPPQSSMAPAAKLPKAERKRKRLARIQNQIQRVQMRLSGHWSSAQLQLETERLLASHQAALKSWHDKDSKNRAQRRYNTIRDQERAHSEKALKKAKFDEICLQQQLNKARSGLNVILGPVSDDEEEGGVLLTEAPTNEERDNGAINGDPPVKFTRSSSRRWIYPDKSKIVTNPANVKLRGSELERALAEAKQEVHIAEVDANYCYFAPLDQQYICLYQIDEYGRIFVGTKNPSKKTRRKELDPEKELKNDTEAGILRTNLGKKPPLWDEIEERMKLGVFKGLTDTLGLGVDEHSLTDVGGKVDALERAMGGSSFKRRHSWMDDEIAPEDLDSESESDSDNDDDNEESD